jgi:hypothetical protein
MAETRVRIPVAVLPFALQMANFCVPVQSPASGEGWNGIAAGVGGEQLAQVLE